MRLWRDFKKYIDKKFAKTETKKNSKQFIFRKNARMSEQQKNRKKISIENKSALNTCYTN